MRRTKRKNSLISNKRVLLLGLGVVLIAGAGAYAYTERRQSNDGPPESIVADPDFSDGTERDLPTTTDKDGTVTETSDSDQSGIDRSNPIVSDSGNISVYMPRQSQVLKPGDTVAGSASVDRVWYRLIDDKVGVIAQGSLKVTGGNFSGVFDFKTTGSEGRLDMFYMHPDTGVESDNVEINIKF